MQQGYSIWEESRVLLFSILKNPTKPTSTDGSFTNLKIFNQTVQIGKINNRVVLPAPFNQLDELEIHAKMTFPIEFVGLNFANPAKTSYAYKLQGYNPHWVYVGSNARVANFANLPSGYYKLYVKVTAKDNGLKLKRLPFIFYLLGIRLGGRISYILD
jgi:hypothetical protein